MFLAKIYHSYFYGAQNYDVYIQFVGPAFSVPELVYTGISFKNYFLILTDSE